MKMEINEKTSYLTYKRMYDYEHGTDYAKQHNEKYFHKTTVETSTTTKITLENGMRNVIGNYNDNNVLIEKMFVHLDSMKRSIALNGLTDDNTEKILHENIMLRELLNIELTLRTMQKNNRK